MEQGVSDETRDMVLIDAATIRLGLTDDEADRLARELARAEIAERRRRQSLGRLDEPSLSEAVAHRREWVQTSMPAHDVHVEAFYIDRTPVTNGQWRAFMAQTGAPRPARWSDDAPDDVLVTGVNWSDATAYAAHHGLALPSEAQWERAARDDRSFFPWGDELEPEGLQAHASGALPFAVGHHPSLASVAGVHDLIGRFGTLCRDDFGPYPGGDVAWFDAHYPSWRGQKVVRGGYSVHQDSTCVYRNGVAPDRRNKFVGFRCVKPA
jgi:formylglycine-generating enzyme required for sulfatase activity